MSAQPGRPPDLCLPGLIEVAGIDASGGPQPPAGVTVRLETRARVLVPDPARLAA